MTISFNRVPGIHLLGIAIICSVFAFGCNTTSTDNSGPRYYEFTSSNSHSGSYNFVAKTSDPAVIDKVEAQLELPQDQRDMHINGEIQRGNAGYNNDWSWHFTEGQWDLAEVSTEVCDGTPQMVENNLDYWVEDVGRFCPFSSIVLREVNPS
ncbi:MAG: hypothetical protein JXR26_06260 [Balneolaceae bacterium]|nr:hypothetical protein [Balneolaceae bacterium]